GKTSIFSHPVYLFLREFSLQDFRGGSETRQFARELNLKPCTTAISSPQSNGMAERFVKTMKEDYIAFMPKPNVRTALHNLAVAIEHYNENHPHSALGYRSPREYRRQRVMLT
ncbi:integrase core domain-containing protein, partial [Escherichia coli]